MVRFSFSVICVVFLAGILGLLGGAGCCKTMKCPTPPLPTKVEQDTGEGSHETSPSEVVVTRKQDPATKVQIQQFREMARSMLKVQHILRWFNRTRGERSVLEATFKGREMFLSRRALAMMNAYLESLGDEVDSKERLAMEYLRDFVAKTYMERKLARLNDELNNQVADISVKIPWKNITISFRDLSGAISNENDPKKRQKLQELRADVVRKKLNPILLKIVGKKNELAQWMGYASYFEFSRKLKRVDVRELLSQGHAFMQKTQGFHQSLMKRVVKESLGKDLDKMNRSDHLRLMRAPKVERFLPRELMMASFKHFLEGIGLDLSTSAGTRIKIDDLPFPKKNPRAACFRVEVPKDVRISVKPQGGFKSWTTLFHEGGHALHFAWTKENRFEFQQLGDSTATEAFAELFARVWAEPEWLERYRRFVQAQNKNRKAHSARLDSLRKRPFFLTAAKMGMEFSRGRKRRRPTPLMGREDMAYLIRHRLAWDMYLYRRYGWAKLIYEAALHGGDESVWRGIYKGNISNRKSLYKDLFGKAYGYDLKDSDAEEYLVDVDPFLYSADYARAFIGADRLIHHLRSKFGEGWFENKKVGPYLKELWAAGTRLTITDIVQKLGSEKLDYSASMERLERLSKPAGMDKSGGEPGETKKKETSGKKRRRPPLPRCRGGAKPMPTGVCPIPTGD